MIFITINLHTTPFEIAINLTYAKILVFTIFNHSSQTNLVHVSYFFHNLVSCFYKQDLLTDDRFKWLSINKIKAIDKKIEGSSYYLDTDYKTNENLKFIKQMFKELEIPLHELSITTQDSTVDDFDEEDVNENEE